MSVIRGILKDSLWLTLAMMLGRGAVVLSGIAITRFFGADVFALFAFIHLTATTASGIAMLGLKNGLPRFLARMQVDDSSAALSRALIAMLIVLFGLSVAVGAMAIAPSQLIGLPDPEARLFLLALTFSIGTNDLLVGVNIGLERFQSVALGTFAMGAVLILGVGIAIWLQNPTLILLAYLLATLASAVLLLAFPIQIIQKRLAVQECAWTRENIYAVGQYIGPMFFSTTLTSTGLWLAGRSLLAEASNEYAFASFAIGMQWFGLAQMLSNVVGKSVLSRFTKTAFLDDRRNHEKILRSSIFISLFGSIMVFVTVFLLSEFILSVYGSEFSGARLGLILFVSASIVAAPIVVLNSDLIARSRYNSVLYCNLAWWLVVVIGAYLTPAGNPVGVIGSIFGAYLLQVVMLFFVVFGGFSRRVVREREK